MDVWDTVIDAVYDTYHHHPADFVWQSDPEHGPGALYSYYNLRLRQQTLRACALTCRAWHKRAGFLLWKHVVLTRKTSCHFAAFLQAMISDTSDYRSLPAVSSLHMSGDYMRELDGRGSPIQPLPYLDSPGITPSENSSSHPGLTATLDRIRRPLFPALTEVYLRGCAFHTMCDFFKFLWSCPRLSHLAMQDCEVQYDPADSSAIAVMHEFHHKHSKIHAPRAVVTYVV